jgi:hypothetical protein
MKRLLIAAAMTLIGMAGFSQSETLIWNETIDVKMDKRQEWEKKFVALAKTHYPDFKYRLWQVTSGENTGNYIIAMGPTSYKQMDVPHVSPKGDMLMRADAQALDALCNSIDVNYYNLVQDISSSKADRKLKYMVATYSEITIGTWADVKVFLARQKEARDKAGSASDIVYLRPSNSGRGNAFMTIRFVEKLEELDKDDFSADTEMYDKLFGSNSFYRDWTKYVSLVKNMKTEIRVLRTDLSNL